MFSQTVAVRRPSRSLKSGWFVIFLTFLFRLELIFLAIEESWPFWGKVPVHGFSGVSVSKTICQTNLVALTGKKLCIGTANVADWSMACEESHISM